MSSVATDAQAAHEHISVGAGGVIYPTLTCFEEPFGTSAEKRYGWPQLEFDEAIGPENRYVICRKLGWGMSSSTWLARDTMDDSYVALKILSGYYTDLVERGCVWELGVLERVSSPPSNPYCLQLKSHFTFPGKGSASHHLCLVTNVLGGDIQLLFAKHGIFPFSLAKRIILYLLRGIAHAHSRGVVHTDLKHDNIFFDTTMSTGDIDNFLASDPSHQHPLENSHDGLINVAVSQPLPIPTLQEAMQRAFVVGDFGSAQLMYTGSHEEITPLSLRPPEIIIGGS